MNLLFIFALFFRLGWRKIVGVEGQESQGERTPESLWHGEGESWILGPQADTRSRGEGGTP